MLLTPLCYLLMAPANPPPAFALPDEPSPWLALVASAVGLAFGVWALLHKESRESREKKDRLVAAHLEWKKEVEGKMENHQQRFIGFSVEHERHCDAVARKFEQQEQRLSEVQRLREDFAGMKAVVDIMVKGLSDVNHKIDRLLERRERHT